YASSRRRRPTIFRRPRRECWSCRCSRRCAVSPLMRSVRIAIWTSGEPVSLSCVRDDSTIWSFCSFCNAMLRAPPQDCPASGRLVGVCIRNTRKNARGDGVYAKEYSTRTHHPVTPHDSCQDQTVHYPLVSTDRAYV